MTGRRALAIAAVILAACEGTTTAVGTGPPGPEPPPPPGPPPPPFDALAFRFCREPHLLCEDFEVPPLGGPPQWSGDPVAPFLSISKERFQSPYAALLAELGADAATGGDGFLVAHEPGNKPITCELRLYFDVKHPTAVASVFEMRAKKDDSTYLDARLELAAGTLRVATTSSQADAASPTTYRFLGALPPYGFSRITMTMTPGAGTVEAGLDGVGTIPPKTFPAVDATEITISLGLRSDAAPWRVFADDLSCDYAGD